MGCLAAWINGMRFGYGKRRMERRCANQGCRGIAARQRFALLNMGEFHHGLMIEIAILLSLKSALVLLGDLCIEAEIARIEPEAEKTGNREPGNNMLHRESHERDCSDKEPMNQVPFSVSSCSFELVILLPGTTG